MNIIFLVASKKVSFLNNKMPIQKKKYAPKRKMIQRKKWATKFKPKRSLTNYSLQPISQRYICKQKYAETITTDSNGYYGFNLNSVYDPNRTGTGHQPYGFDTLAALYNRYRVIACGWRIQVNGVPGVDNVICATLPANEVISTSTMSAWRENPRAKFITQSAGGGMVTLSGKSYIPSLVGRTKLQYMSDDRYQSQVNDSPNELAILNIVTSTIGAGVSGDQPEPVTIQVLLEYTVEYFDVKTLSQS